MKIFVQNRGAGNIVTRADLLPAIQGITFFEQQRGWAKRQFCKFPISVCCLLAHLDQTSAEKSVHGGARQWRKTAVDNEIVSGCR
jgi:hypothetical protein